MIWQHSAVRLVLFVLKPAAWAVRKYRATIEQERLEIETEALERGRQQDRLAKYHWDN